MRSLSKSFTALGDSDVFMLAPGEDTHYAVTGSFTGFVRLDRSDKGDSFKAYHVGAVDAGFSGRIKNETPHNQFFKFRAKDTDGLTPFTGQADCVIAPSVDLSNPAGVRAAVAAITVIEHQDGAQHQTLLRCQAFDLGAFGDEAGQGQYAGALAYTFPQGAIEFEGAVLQGSITLTAPAIDAWAGSIGLGVTVPVDHQDAANLTGAVMPKVAIAAATAKVGAVDALSVATALTESGARWLDGTAAAKALYLNLLVDDDAAHDNTITGTFTGTILVTWKNLGDN